MSKEISISEIGDCDEVTKILRQNKSPCRLQRNQKEMCEIFLNRDSMC